MMTPVTYQLATLPKIEEQISNLPQNQANEFYKLMKADIESIKPQYGEEGEQHLPLTEEGVEEYWSELTEENVIENEYAKEMLVNPDANMSYGIINENYSDVIPLSK